MHKLNKESQKILDYIHNSPETQEKISNIKASNIKEYIVLFGYILNDILNTNVKFRDYPRKEVDIIGIAHYFK